MDRHFIYIKPYRRFDPWFRLKVVNGSLKKYRDVRFCHIKRGGILVTDRGKGTAGQLGRQATGGKPVACKKCEGTNSQQSHPRSARLRRETICMPAG